jgi:hypothetical protein
MEASAFGELCNRDQHLIAAQEPRCERRVVASEDGFAAHLKTARLDRGAELLLVVTIVAFDPASRVTPAGDESRRDLADLNGRVRRLGRRLQGAVITIFCCAVLLPLM